MGKLSGSKHRNLLVFILTVGVFGIINTEMGVVGILPLIAETFGVTVPTAGWVVSAFALVVAISGPIMPLLFSGINRKKVMLIALGIFVLSNIVSILTTNFTVILIARIIPAIFHPIYVSMAFSVAATSVSKEQAPKAVSRIFIGVSAGMVLGIPVTSLIASETSFSIAMLFFAIVNAMVFIATIFLIPSIPVKERLSYGTQLSVLKKPIIWNSLIAVTFINGAMFGFFSFMSDFLKNITQLDFKVISMMLFIYGGANIIGNLIAGKLLVKIPSKCIKTIPFAMVVVYVALFLMGEHFLVMGGIILILGILAGIASNNCQYMITHAAPEAPDFANGLFLTSTNLGTAVGTAFCGMFITALDTRYAVIGTLIFLIIGIVFVFLRQRDEKRVLISQNINKD
ncbi:MFS transporter [uncultured Apibacter sp.]|uniref:MFS transporter n=1 Tax=uncultured Apibacter sp. TaxID=1778616 RepID=UPI0025E6F4FB|nr:MFS transporter [uncultured Apibacter sp.]